MTLKPGSIVRVMRGFSRGEEGAISEVIDEDKARMEVSVFGSKRETEVSIADLDHPDVDPRRWMRGLLQDQLGDRRNDEFLRWWSVRYHESPRDQPLEDYRAFITWRDQNTPQLDQQCQPVFDQFEQACFTPSYEADQHEGLIAKWEANRQAWMDAIRPAPLSEDDADIATAKKYREEAFDAYVEGSDDEEACRLRWCLVGMPTPHDAVLSQSLSKLRAAIGVGQDLNEFNDDGHTPLSIAAAQGLTEIISVLIENGADVNTKKDDSWPPLFCTARFGQSEATQALIAAGANLDIPGWHGRRPLHAAAEYGKLDVLRMLLDAGADVNSLGDNRETALWVATNSPFHEAIEVLIRAGANVNLPNETGVSPLANVIYRENIPGVQLLLASGANVNAQDQYTGSPLYNAAQHGQLEIVRLLVGAGANVNIQTGSCQTPLYAAAEENYVEVMQFLIEHGADLTVRNAYGKTALDAAEEGGHAEAAKLLRDAQKNANE